MNRDEFTAIVLAVRKAMTWSTDFRHLIVFSDIQLCVNDINEWMDLWEADGWTRMGNTLENVDL